MILSKDSVMLVDEQDVWIGTADKAAVHRTGALHRALSIFLINSRGEILLQQRAEQKYHSGGLWSNACCSHPTPDEPTYMAAYRRLREELGIDTILTHVAKLRYRTNVTNNLIEHEYDHIFTGEWNGDIHPSPDEVSDIRWITPEALDVWIASEPEAFTAWFPILLQAWRESTKAREPEYA
jgi:isopentenyl-diphosphate delta-isomerase